MTAKRIVERKIPLYIAAAVVLLVFASGCPAQQSPVPVGERATPTPAPTAANVQGSTQATEAPTAVPGTPTPAPTLEPTAAVATVEARQEQHLASLFEPSVGALKFAEWDEKSVQFSNALLGYILVYGYDFSVEIVQVEGDAYQDAFQNGELDAVLMLDRAGAGDWYVTHIDAAAISDLGSVRDGDDGLRLVVHSGLADRAPEVTEFLENAKPTDALIDELSARISAGRIGIKPTTQAIKFLKEHEDIWVQWVPASVAEKVKAAIEAGKTSLVNRKCIPVGGSGGGSPNCGT